MPSHQPLNYLLISQAAAAAFAVARLLHFRLSRRFPLFCVYLLMLAVFSGFFSVTSPGSPLYFAVYMVAEPVTWCAAALAVFEMFALVFHDYPGLRTAGRWAVYTAIATSGFISALVGARLPEGVSRNTRLLYVELVADRSVQFSLAAIIIVLMWFLSRYPLYLDRNTYVASGFFSAIFLSQAVVKMIDALSPRLIARNADYPEVGFTALCLLGWGAMMRRWSTSAPSLPHDNKPRETELLQQLESINDILSRSGGR